MSYMSSVEHAKVTLFSAPNYCGEFDNAGAMMTLDEHLGFMWPSSPEKFKQKSKLDRSRNWENFQNFPEVCL